MNRNQKIALGCGGAGCLALIVIVIAGVLLYMFAGRSLPTNRNRSTNLNSNTNSSRSTNRNSNSTSTNSDTDTPTNSENVTPSTSLSEDDKHKLYQAAGITGDHNLIQRVLKKIGYMDESGMTTSGYDEFVRDHATWAIKNYDFITSVNSAEKGRAYVEEHMDD